MNRLFLLFVIFTCCSFLFSCGSSSGENSADKCTQHIDFNCDLICDNCENKLEPVCKSHSDYDGDGVCDSIGCGELVNTEPDDTQPQETPCEKCTDSDNNLMCDLCGKEIPAAPQGVTLIKDGNVRFSLLIEYDSLDAEETEAINGFLTFLESLDITPKIYTDGPAPDTDVGIIVNSVSFLGEEYAVNVHYLGPKGYAVVAENDKILLRAGSAESLGTAFEYLAEKAFSEKTSMNSVFLFSDSVEFVQSDYKFGTALIGENDAKNYTIAYERFDEHSFKLAEKIRKTLYENTGLWLELIPSDECGEEKCILIKSQEKSGGVGFYTSVKENGNFEIISEFTNKTLDAGNEYIRLIFGIDSDTLVFAETQINTRDVFYADFGAAGDGITDDFDALKSAHDYANEHGHRVVANNGCTYYVGKADETITIRTDTDWGSAKFIIDDRSIEYGGKAEISIFTVASDYESIILDAEDTRILSLNESGGIAKDCESINLNLGYAAILIIEDAEHSESVLVDENGNLSFPLRSDFDTVKSIEIIRADDEPITLEGGAFTVYSNLKRQSEPFARNIKILRSNTLIRYTEYRVSFAPEKNDGASPYLAFIEIDKAYGVTVSNISFYSRILYSDSDKSPVISANLSHSITIRNCEQNNFFAADEMSVSKLFAASVCIFGSDGIVVDGITANILYFDGDTYRINVKNSALHKIDSRTNDVTEENNVTFK